MFSPWAVLGAIFVYMGVLFTIAQWAERTKAGRKLAAHPAVYALGLAVYCTTWTFYGSVGKASQGGMGFIPVYLGPTLAFLLGHQIFRKMARLKHAHRITSIADFISARYNKSQAVAAIVTVIMMVGIVPYVGLQLKAVTGSFNLMTAQTVADGSPWASLSSPIVVVLMIGFTIAFGIRHLDPTERHPGMVMSLASESITKIVAFIAAGVFVVGLAFGDFGGFVEHMKTADLGLPMMGEASSSQIMVWFTVGLLAAAAFAFLPRQFHVGVVENDNEKHVKTAQWLTLLYLIAINLLVVPIAMGGNFLGFEGVKGDQYVLALPMKTGATALSMLVFVGGFSAAIGMIMVAGMTTATMISNHLVMPIAQAFAPLKFLQRRMLYVRWVAAAAFIGGGYAFEALMGDSYMLVAIGLISFAAAFIVAPVVLAGLFWREGSQKGALIGLCGGFATWFYTLLMPTFVKSGWLPKSILEEGPMGLGFLRPEALFGLEGMPSLTHGVMFSAGVTIIGYVAGSVLMAPDKEERRLTDEFLDIDGTSNRAFEDDEANTSSAEFWDKTVALLEEFYDPDEARDLTARCFERTGCANQENSRLSNWPTYTTRWNAPWRGPSVLPRPMGS